MAPTGNNGFRKNLTIKDIQVIEQLEQIRGETLTWDETMKRLLETHRVDRISALDLKLKEIQDWAEYHFSDRPDIIRAIEKARAILTNQFFLSNSVRMLEIGSGLDDFHRDKIKELRKIENEREGL